MTRFLCSVALSCVAVLPALPRLASAAESDLPRVAKSALHKACQFYREQVSANGGYLWRYSADLAKREGEGRAGELTVWVQPPGTPSVGMSLLEAYELTGDAYCLELACDAGRCLAQGQLCSGGWDYRIEFDPARRQRYAYRVDSPKEKARNTSTLDDNATQAALRLLIRLDEVLQFKDEQIHEAAEFALSSLLAAQYPNGGWPQRFDRPPDPELYPVKKASYPATWPREYPRLNYSGYYTFNDNTIADTIGVMFLAAQIYQNPEYSQAAEKAGDFILLAQMPDPQPGWAQQYDPQMHPAWARRFEPAAITGGEAGGILRTLMMVYRETGKKKYIEPIPRALEYYGKSKLPEGGLARFYELKTNRPLYFTREYELTYDDGDLPTHYAFKVGDWVRGIAKQYEQLLKTPPEDLKPSRARYRPRLSESLEERAREVIARLDDRGAWVEKGGMRYHGADDDTSRVIDSRTFISNLRVLATYLAAADSRDG